MDETGGNIYPEDWPAGAIDLAVHDRPHASSMVEWWYYHAHLKAADGGRYAFFVSFFRVQLGYDESTGAARHGHMLTWAISDVGLKRYHTCSRVEDSLRAFALDKINRGELYKNKWIRQAVKEIFAGGDVPRPDRLFTVPVSCSTTSLDCAFGDSFIRREGDGSYSIRLADGQMSCDLKLRPRKGPARHGRDGVTLGVRGEAMFYYFVPRSLVSGTISIGERELEVSGEGWYDHQFGDRGRDEEGKPVSLEQGIAVAWDWCGIQLDDGSDVTVSAMKDKRSGKEGAMAVLLGPDGAVSKSSAVRFGPARWWRSMRTFEEYPVAWRFEAPELGLELSLAAVFEDQEFITMVSKPAFWEGELEVSGTMGGKNVKGMAYAERSGFVMFHDLDAFFSAIGSETRRLVDDLYPLMPGQRKAAALFAHEKRPHLLEDVDVGRLRDNLIRPVRDITDRGGKAWRSYAMIACCDAVGGDVRKFYRWLAIPELIHTGALIIDDLEDESEVRRGGPSVHRVYGRNTAINAGTNAYFGPHGIVHSSEISDRDKLRVYDYYFEALREAHAGQAIDLAGFDALADDAAGSGDSARLERGLLAMYRLKTAAPVACMARMGAIIGGGSGPQVDALGTYFERIGTAFQVVDDVLNLRGFKGNRKTVGEDIMAGKITMPVAKALGRLGRDERKSLLELVRSRPGDPEAVKRAIMALEECGALDACISEARALVESAWEPLEPVLQPSISKIMLRVLGWYVLERDN